MKHIFAVFGFIGAFCVAVPAIGASAGTVALNGTSRGVSANYATSSNTTTGRGYQGLANAYQMNQRNTYYMITQPDVDSACREKIYNCLAEY